MQTDYNTEGTSVLEELILACRPCVERMARKYAREWYRVDYEEFVSIGMLEICKFAPHAYAATTNPMAYLCKAAQNEMLDELNRMRRLDTTSLDAPLTSDSSLSLADLLPDRSPVSELRSAVKRGRAVRGAVKRLSPARRKAVKHFYGLPGVGRSTDVQAAQVLGVSRNAVNKAVGAGHLALRSDELLCKVVGVEVAR